MKYSRLVFYIITFGLSFFIILPIKFEVDQIYLGWQQDGCYFGFVDNAEYKSLYEKALLNKKYNQNYFESRKNNVTYEEQINKLAPYDAHLFYRIAAMHAVMRANNMIYYSSKFSVRKDWQFSSPAVCEPQCRYYAMYVSSRKYSILNLFFIPGRVRYGIRLVQNFDDTVFRKKKSIEPVHGFLESPTNVSVNLPNIKDSAIEVPFNDLASCPRIPPVSWVDTSY